MLYPLIESVNETDLRRRLAVQFIQTHEAQHLHSESLVHRCVAYLVARWRVPVNTAYDLAMHALAERQQRQQPVAFDLKSSTPAVVRVVDPATGQVAAFTAGELWQLAQQQAAQPTDRTHITRQCGRRADHG